jgi:hypothetical protein
VRIDTGRSPIGYGSSKIDPQLNNGRRLVDLRVENLTLFSAPKSANDISMLLPLPRFRLRAFWSLIIAMQHGLVLWVSGAFQSKIAGRHGFSSNICYFDIWK